MTVEYTPLKLTVSTNKNLQEKLPKNWVDVKVTLRGTNAAVANGIRRTALLYMEVPTLHIDYSEVVTDDDLVLKLLPDIRTKISQLKLDYRLGEGDNVNAKFIIDVANTTQDERVITSSDIVSQKSNNLVGYIPRDVKLFTLARRCHVRIPVTIKVATGAENSSNIFTRSIRYKDLDYVDVYRMNYTGNVSLIRASKAEVTSLLRGKKVKVLRNTGASLDSDPPILLIPNKAYLLKMTKVYLDDYSATTNVMDTKHASMTPDDIIAKLSKYFSRYAIVAVGLTDEVDNDDELLKNWSSAEAYPTNYQLIFRLWGNIPGELYLERLIAKYRSKLIYIKDNLENPSVVEKNQELLQTDEGTYEVNRIRLFNEDETVANAIRCAMFELDPDIPLVYYQRPCNAEQIIEIVYIHPDRNIIIKSIDAVIATLEKFKAGLKK